MMLLKKFLKYGLVGGVYSIATIGVYWLFVDTLHYKAVIVSLIWIPLSFVIRFFIDKKFVWKV